MNIDTILAELKKERERLDNAIAALEGVGASRGTKSSVNAARGISANKPKRHGLTVEGRRRLSEAMKKRWAERRKRRS
jgi:hypothetical protein